MYRAAIRSKKIAYNENPVRRTLSLQLFAWNEISFLNYLSNPCHNALEYVGDQGVISEYLRYIVYYWP